MNLTLIDWGVIGAVFALMLAGVLYSKSQMRSVADYLSANRTAGRYLVSVSEGIAALGAISIVGFFEQYYNSGFTMMWWDLTMVFFLLVAFATGWVVYRFRETRCMTMAQFFEIRYSKNFRIFAGILAFVSGLINFGIFPAVGAKFFINYCGFPATFSFIGLQFSTYVVTMLILLNISLFFVFVGGQISVIVADFIQGIFVNFIFIVMVIYFMFKFDFTIIFEALQTAPENASLIDPFKTGQAKDFNFWFFFIGVIGFFYNTLSWQGTQAYNSSAENAHEAKMGKVLSIWRLIPQKIFYLFIPVVAYTVLHHVNFQNEAIAINDQLAELSTEMQSQARVPLVLTNLLPIGLFGAFAAVMLGAFISTHDTYLHSWGSIFIQDVILPFRKKPLEKDEHIKLLRWSVIGVAVFIFIFSLLFKQTQYIIMFLALTGAIFVGGSGAVIVGGLYWKRGTTAGAWSALITGSAISVGGVILHQLNEDFFINGQWFWLLAMTGGSLVYVIVSLMTSTDADLDKILFRDQKEEKSEDRSQIIGFKKLLGGSEFNFRDRMIYLASYIWIISWLLVFIIGTIIYFTVGITELSWMKYWYIYMILNVIAAIIVFIWFTIGGMINLKSMFKKLNTMERDHSDNGEYVR